MDTGMGVRVTRPELPLFRRVLVRTKWSWRVRAHDFSMELPQAGAVYCLLPRLHRFGGPDAVAKPEVAIEVEDETGRWTVDGLPMILMPEHFFLNNHFAVEDALGREELGRILAPAGYRSAYHWCEREAAHHGIFGEEVFRHYMRRLSQRGWAQFRVVELDGAAGCARVQVTHSVFVTGRRKRRS